ncbi:hypothetical protein ACWC9T_00880 [Kitasatospora sp. NPDC001159]
MTDKFPRLGGGDGDGPGETSTEQLLREAMNARTSLITAHSLRPAAPPRTRVRRLRPVYLTTAPILALAASVAIGVFAFHGDPVAKQDVPPPPAASVTTSPSPTATPTPTPTATPTGTGSPTGDAEQGVPLADVTPSSIRTPTSTPTGSATSYSFRGVKFKVPAGWKAVPVADRMVCVLSPGAPTDPQQNWAQAACKPYGVLVTAYNSLDESQGGAWPTTADMDNSAGWSHQGNCPVWGSPHTPATGELNSVGPTKSTVTVAGRSAVKSEWQGTCGQASFTAQMWGLPKDQVFVTAAGLKDDYQAGLQSIVNSLDLSGRQAPPTEASQNDIAVSIDGLAPGQQLRVGSAVVTFSVTFRNTSQNTYGQLQPLVITDRYAGTPTVPGAQLPNDGKLELQTDSGWTTKPMSPGSDMSYAMVQDQEVFSLAPGQSRKLTYRLTMGPKSGPGDMPLKAQVMLPYRGGDMTVLGRQDITVKVVW